jgi:alpha-tubulin suppressor-like RCC1 family protein
MNLVKIIFATGFLLSFLIPEVYGEVTITLNGDNPLTNAYGTPFIDSGANVSAPPLAIGAGFDFSLALKADGTVVAWGNDQFGQLEIPTNLTNVIAINTQAVQITVWP